MDADIRDLFTFPPYYLVYGLEWPDPRETMAEAAFALAPACVPKKGLPKDVDDVLVVSEVYAHEHPGQRMVWFTDLTLWLESKGTNWANMDIDWERALRTIPELSILGLYMTISKRAYHHLINTAERMTVHYTNGTSEVLTAEEREKVHDAFIDQLDRDWPRLISEMIESGRLTVD